MWHSRRLAALSVLCCGVVGTGYFCWAVAPGPLPLFHRVAAPSTCEMDGVFGRSDPFLAFAAHDAGCIASVFPPCEVDIEYSVSLDARGIVRGLEVPDGLSIAQRDCIRTVSSQDVWLPAHDCNAKPVPSTGHAGIWRMCGSS